MLTFTKIQTLKPEILSKSFSLKDNKLHSEPGGKLSEGISHKMSVKNIREFSDILVSLAPSEALLFGTTKHKESRVYSRSQLEKLEKNNKIPVNVVSIARTRDSFSFEQAPGILMLDYDPYGPKVLTREQLLEKLYAAWPALRNAPHVWRPSVSSCLINMKTGEVLKPLRGQRVYVAVENAHDIIRAGKNLYERLWLSGDGFYSLSKSGAILDRNIIDASVWQPERLDFCGGANCKPPIVQKIPAPVVYNEFKAPVDTLKTLPDFTLEEMALLKKFKRESREKIKPTMDKVRKDWIEERIKSTPHVERKVFDNAIKNRVLYGDFVLHSENGKTVTINELLKSPEKYNGTRFKDPLEPDYGNGSFLAWVNLSVKEPYINSFAHGGLRYSLKSNEKIMSQYLEHIKENSKNIQER